MSVVRPAALIIPYVWCESTFCYSISEGRRARSDCWHLLRVWKLGGGRRLQPRICQSRRVHQQRRNRRLRGGTRQKATRFSPFFAPHSQHGSETLGVRLGKKRGVENGLRNSSVPRENGFITRSPLQNKKIYTLISNSLPEKKTCVHL